MTAIIVEGARQPYRRPAKLLSPKDPADQKWLGVRYDYNDEVIKEVQLQANAGEDIPSSIKKWKAANDGT